MEDIAPGLLETIRESFRQSIQSSKKIQALYKAIQDGNATYIDAEEYAYQVGEALSQAFGKHLSSAALPDGRMYFNIADRVLRPMLEEDHGIVSDAATMVQTALNQKAGIGIKAQTVAVNEDRIYGIVDKVSNADSFDDVAWLLDAPVKNFSMSVVDEILKANVDFQGKAGLRPKIIRKAERKCCEWCSRLAGEYDYPDVPDDVYRRHENCRCTVDYDPGDGKKYQNVHTKQWKTAEEHAKLEERKRYSAMKSSASKKKSRQSTVWNDAVGSRSWQPEQQKAMYSAEYGTTRNKIEVSRLYDATGKRLFKKNGDVSSVTFTPDEIKQMQGGILTHNHPGGGCFSPNDINMLRFGKLQEIRAVTPDGIYRMQAPTLWSRSISNLTKINQAYYDIDANISKPFFDRARSGEISFYEADLLSQHAVVEAFCKQYNIPFAFDSWDSIREAIK